MSRHFRVLSRNGASVLLLEPKTPEGRTAISEWAEKVRAEERQTNPHAMGPFVDCTTGVLSVREAYALRFFREVQVSK